MDAAQREAEFAFLTDAALALPAVHLEHRLAWDGIICWVGRPQRRRMFAFCCETPTPWPGAADDPVLTLKGPPELNAALTGAHSWITPGWHFNKRHWISLHLRDDAFSKELAQDLLAAAHAVTIAALPKSERPRT